MFVKPGDVVRFTCFYQSSSTGLGVSGLTVYVAVNRGTTNAITLVSNTAASPLDATNMPGWYYYDYTVPDGYYGILTGYFVTADSSVSQRGGASFYISAQWVVYVDVAVSSRLASAAYTAAPTVNAIADQVWDETAADHNTSGTMGNKLNAAGGASDPMLNEASNYPTPGTLGNIIGNIGARSVNYIGSVNGATGELPLRVADAYTSATPHGRVRVSHDIVGFDLTAVTVTSIKLMVKAAAEKYNPDAAALIYVTADAVSLTADEAEFTVSTTDTAKLVAGGGYVWFASCLVSDVPFTWGEGTTPALPKGRT